MRMIAKARARFSGGALHLLEPLDLVEGQEVVVSVEGASTETKASESILEMFERLRNSVPPDTWDGLPADLVRNKKHYLYGPSEGRGMKGALFADSGYWIALLHPRDQMHERAMSAAAGLGDVPIVTTQMALAEVLNHLSKEGEQLRHLALQMVRGLEDNPNVEIIPAD